MWPTRSGSRTSHTYSPARIASSDSARQSSKMSPYLSPTPASGAWNRYEGWARSSGRRSHAIASHRSAFSHRSIVKVPPGNGRPTSLRISSIVTDAAIYTLGGWLGTG